MTLLVEQDELADERRREVAAPPPRATRPSPSRVPDAPSVTTRTLLGVWLLATVAGFALVLYGFGPILQDRSQRKLLGDYRTSIDQAANESSGLAGVSVPTRAPELGAPIGILEIGELRLQEAIVEGAGASETRLGPGHVPGTAGPGQPGHSVIVGRRRALGGSFAGLARLRRDDLIVVSTTQGVSVYAVEKVRHVTVRGERDDPATAGANAPSPFDSLYGPTEDDRLTLVTSASAWPGNKDRALVVSARLKGAPFAPTPQGARSDAQTGAASEQGARAAVLLAMIAYGAVLGGAVLIYQRARPRIAYLLTVGPVLAMTVIAAETLVRLLPAWT